MAKATSILFLGLALVLALPTLGSAAEICPAETAAPANAEAFLAALQTAPSGAGAQVGPAELALEERGFTFCTKEVCSVARMECREGCLPCSFTFQCQAPSCQGPCQCVC